MRLFPKIKDLWVDLLPDTPINGPFSTKKLPKKALNVQNLQPFYIYPTLSCLKSSQLTWMLFFFRIKKLWVDSLPTSLRWPFFIKIPIVLYRSYMVMPNKYPVNLDALREGVKKLIIFTKFSARGVPPPSIRGK